MSGRRFRVRWLVAWSVSMLAVYPATGQQTALKVSDSGDVGIGTNTPAAKLDITGVGASQTNLQITTYGGGVTQLPASNGNFYITADSTMGTDAGRTIIRFWDGSSSNVAATFNHPSSMLRVFGDVYATGTVTWSDQNLKKDIQTLEEPIDKIMLIRGVSYLNDSDALRAIGITRFENGIQYGLIAEEVAQIIPEVVRTVVEEDGKAYQGILYERLIPLLIESTKAQQLQIEELLATNQALIERVEQLETAIGVKAIADQ